MYSGAGTSINEESDVRKEKGLSFSDTTHRDHDKVQEDDSP